MHSKDTEETMDSFHLFETVCIFERYYLLVVNAHIYSMVGFKLILLLHIVLYQDM
jgi:hypothetical protein